MKIVRTIKNSGVMLLQLIIGITVIMIMSGIVAANFSSFRHQQALENSAGDVTALLAEARSRTLSGDGGNFYGVHFETGKAVLFLGDTYSAGTEDNKQVMLDSGIEIVSVSLAGGGSDVVFTPLTGSTEEYGTFVMKKVASTTGMQTFTITEAGQVSGR